jgi:ABC-type sugar transport system ATPase subunit
VRATNIEQEAGTLSGGNQQKVMLAKWLETRPKVLLLEEPTRGVDVGAKEEIYDLIDELAAAGIAIVLVTSETPELLRLADRVAVMHRGRITAEYSRAEASPEKIMRAAMGEVA